MTGYNKFMGGVIVSLASVITLVSGYMVGHSVSRGFMTRTECKGSAKQIMSDLATQAGNHDLNVYNLRDISEELAEFSAHYPTGVTTTHHRVDSLKARVDELDSALTIVGYGNSERQACVERIHPELIGIRHSFNYDLSRIVNTEVNFKEVWAIPWLLLGLAGGITSVFIALKGEGTKSPNGKSEESKS